MDRGVLKSCLVGIAIALLVFAIFVVAVAVEVFAAPVEPVPDMPISAHFTVVEVSTTVRSTGEPLDGVHYVVRHNSIGIELVTDHRTPVRWFIFHGDGTPVVDVAFGHGALPVSPGTVTASTSTSGKITHYSFHFWVDFPD